MITASRSHTGRRVFTLVLLSVLAAGAVWLKAPVVLRSLAALLLVLVLPGWPWLMYNQRWRRPLETVALVIATSLGITIVVGVALNLLPWHLTSRSWAAGLLLASLVGAGGLWVRGLQPELEPRQARAVAALGARLGSPSSPRRIALLASGAIALLGLLAVLAVVSIESQRDLNRREHFSVLGLGPTSATRLTTDVVNHEGSAVRYRLLAISEGKTVFQRPVALSSGAQTRVEVQVPADTVLLDSSLKIELLRDGQRGVYRLLSLRPQAGRWP